MKINLSKENQRKIASLCMQYIKESDAVITRRITDWRAAETSVQAALMEADAARKARREKEESVFTQVKIPYTLAILLTEHTYLCSVFLGRNPVLQLDGNNATGQDSVLSMETVLSYQLVNGDMLPPLYVFLYDLCLYGVSALVDYWAEETTYITESVDEGITVAGLPLQNENGEQETEEKIAVKAIRGYHGNRLTNVKPKDLIIDTRVGFLNYQEGEVVGRRVLLNRQAVKRSDGYFNTEYLKGDQGNTDLDSNPALLETSYYCGELDSELNRGMFRAFELCVKLVPSDFGLGPNDNEEIWMLTLTSDGLLIGAQPQGYYHGKFMYTLAVREFDGYTLSSRGVPEVGEQLNDTMNWLVNSHMFNVERTMNNEFIFDPSIINQKDFMDPAPGKRIRVKAAGYGTDLRKAFMQIPQYDVTKSHLQDIKLVESLFQRVFGINDQMLGALSQGGRKTATEVRSASGFGLNRLKTLAEFLSAQTFSVLTRKLVSNSLQYYDASQKFAITGADGLDTIKEFTAEEITGEFAYSPVDGTIPIDRMAQTMIYKELLGTIATMPQIGGRYDVASFFAFIAKMAGIKNLNSFEIGNERVNKVRQEAALGREVVGNGNTNSGTEGGAANSPGLAGTPTASGMGPLG